VSLVIAGIDEAGYGPMLGPLCVGMSVFRIDAAPAGDDGWPDLWAALSAAVVREPREAERQGKLAVGDSKRLKLSNQLKTRHPLTHLERGVLAFGASCWGGGVEDDVALLDRLGARLDGEGTREPWYGGSATALPLSTTADHVRVLSAQVEGALERAGVRLLELRCVSITEGAFNRQVERWGSKAAVSWEAALDLVQRVWRSSSALRSPAPRVMVDRQGGRRSYAALLERLGRGVVVETVSEGETGSVYEARGPGPGGERRIRVAFAREAEDRQLPVALASMGAKLVRELSMARFNRYWGSRCAELKPTAGYVQDARRWIEDARRAGVVDDTVVRGLCRRA
jgi:hypothetical protein